MINFWCWIGVHSWGPWMSIMINYSHMELVDAQERFCLKCNKNDCRKM